MRGLQCVLLAAVTAIGFASIASASDLPVKASMPVKAAPLPLAYNWSGIYIGGNLGGAWDNMHAFWPGRTPGTIGDFDHNGTTGVAGAHVGIQYQWTNIVLGVEAAWFANFDNREFTGSPNSGCPNVTFTCQAVVDSIWTVGPRVGWAVNDWLLYGTGGYANGNVNTRSFTTATGVNFDDFSSRHGGWFAGAGIEYALWKMPTFDTILGVEYQHIDLGTVRMLSPGDGGVFGLDTRDIRSTVDVVRARLTFKANVFGR